MDDRSSTDPTKTLHEREGHTRTHTRHRRLLYRRRRRIVDRPQKIQISSALPPRSRTQRRFRCDRVVSVCALHLNDPVCFLVRTTEEEKEQRFPPGIRDVLYVQRVVVCVPSSIQSSVESIQSSSSVHSDVWTAGRALEKVIQKICRTLAQGDARDDDRRGSGVELWTLLSVEEGTIEGGAGVARWVTTPTSMSLSMSVSMSVSTRCEGRCVRRKR